MHAYCHALAMAHQWRRLAASGCCGADAMAGVNHPHEITPANGLKLPEINSLAAAIFVVFDVIFIYHNGMNSVADLVAELARFNPDPARAQWITSALQEHRDQAQKDSAEVRRQITLREAELRAAQTRIQALTLELAHLRRMRFGVRNEALSAEQRDLFQETLASDLRQPKQN